MPDRMTDTLPNTTTTPRLEDAGFGLQELPGESLHPVLRAFRERGPIEPTCFLGLPSFVITTHEALEQAFLDELVDRESALPRRTVLRAPAVLPVRRNRRAARLPSKRTEPENPGNPTPEPPHRVPTTRGFRP